MIEDIGINPATHREAWLIERNKRVTDQRLTRVAAHYAGATTDHPEILKWVSRISPSDPRGDWDEWLLLCGPVGTGKTHAAIAALRLAVQAPGTVVWHLATCSQMLEDFRPGGTDDADARYLRSDILIIDDLTMVKTNSEWAVEQIYRVVNERRNNGRITVLTSNEPPSRLKELLNEQIVSRIVQRCAVIALTGVDRRRERTSQ